MKHKRLVVCVILSIFIFALILPNKRAAADDYSVEYCKNMLKSSMLAEFGGYINSEEASNIVGKIYSANGAVERGCTRCLTESSKVGKGVAWINGYPENTIIGSNHDAIVQSIENMYSTVSNAAVIDNTITVYFHGVTYGCAMGADAMNYDGVELHVLDAPCHPGWDTDDEPNCGQRNNATKWAFINNHNKDYIKNVDTLAGSTLGRFSHNSVGSFAWSFPGRNIAVQIDVDKFKNEAARKTEKRNPLTGNIMGYEYEDDIYVYRCPALVDGRDGWYAGRVSSSCGTDDSTIRIYIPEEPDTCTKAHQNDPDYGDTYNGAPSWFTSLGIYYNKCYGESVLGTRVSTKNINESNYTERAILKNSDSTRTATVYVKPGTNVQIDQFYFPAAQPVTKTIVDDERLTAKDGSGNAITIPRTASNSVTLSGSGNIDASWTNFKDIGTIDEGAVGNGSVNFTFTRGGYNNAPSFNDSNNTGTVHTGNTITETNSGDSSILGRASVGNLDENGVTNVKKSVESTTVTVIAPYNFTNSVGLSGANFQAGAFAGSEVSFGASYTTNGKNNQWIPGGAYATISPNSKLRLYSFVSDSANPSQNCNPDGDTPAECKTHYSKNNFALNENENPSAKHDTELYTVSIPDVDAGKYFCVVAAVWPTSSGADDNYTNPSGNGQWEIKKQCVRIQKRAFFQVWGGNVYAKGKVSSSTTTKKTVGGTTYSPAITFGSWTEHGIIASKKEVTGVASGAALGYTSNDDGNLINSPGGKSGASKNCRFSTFTIANTDCYINTGINDAATPGYSNIDLSNNLLDLTNYTNTARSTTSRGSSAESQLDLASEYTEKDGIRYTYAVGSLYLKSSAALPKGTTHVVYATGSVYIHSNLNYQNTTYSNPSDMPQLIIIAGGNINVDGAVTNIDAWLYTKSGTIDTCMQGNTTSACSRQLRINGPIVAGKMVLDRNYGGGTGNDSGTPAEIINFTPATYIFSQAKSTENTSLRVVYSKEIAPRY